MPVKIRKIAHISHVRSRQLFRNYIRKFDANKHFKANLRNGKLPWVSPRLVRNWKNSRVK